MVLFAYGWSSYLAGVYNSLKHKLRGLSYAHNNFWHLLRCVDNYGFSFDREVQNV